MSLSDDDVESLQVLVANLAARDEDASSHDERCAGLIVALAAALGLSDVDTVALHWIAELHDLGKTTFPRGLRVGLDLANDKDWEAIHSHPEVAAHMILLACPAAEAIADAVRHHHERFDGEGYPSQQKGECIPLLSRIMAVIDSYDAMLTIRSYRPMLGTAQALAVLRGGAAKQWDPDVVDAFVSLWDA